MTLQLYLTVVRRSQTGWIETTGLKKSLGIRDGRGVGLVGNPPASTSLQALLLLVVLLLVVMVVVVEVTTVVEVAVLLLRPPLLPVLWLLSAWSATMTHVPSLLCSHHHDCSRRRWLY